MGTTVQQTAPDAIGQTRDPNSEKSYGPFRYQHWSDAHWEERGLRPAIELKLARVDRALQTIGTLHELLVLNFQAGAVFDDEPDAAGLRLSSTQQEGLHCAIQMLHEDASWAMCELRDNTDGCWGKKGGRA
ncbi:hypothetical protein QEG26_002793 [Stenotrophomonas maltophilia]|nr:hypothetical protein [Stenotrophomonas maltophilia]